MISPRILKVVVQTGPPCPFLPYYKVQAKQEKKKKDKEKCKGQIYLDNYRFTHSFILSTNICRFMERTCYIAFERNRTQCSCPGLE